MQKKVFQIYLQQKKITVKQKMIKKIKQIYKMKYNDYKNKQKLKLMNCQKNMIDNNKQNLNKMKKNFKIFQIIINQ